MREPVCCFGLCDVAIVVPQSWRLCVVFHWVYFPQAPLPTHGTKIKHVQRTAPHAKFMEHLKPTEAQIQTDIKTVTSLPLSKLCRMRWRGEGSEEGENRVKRNVTLTDPLLHQKAARPQWVRANNQRQKAFVEDEWRWEDIKGLELSLPVTLTVTNLSTVHWWSTSARELRISSLYFAFLYVLLMLKWIYFSNTFIYLAGWKKAQSSDQK